MLPLFICILNNISFLFIDMALICLDFPSLLVYILPDGKLALGFYPGLSMSELPSQFSILTLYPLIITNSNAVTKTEMNK